MIRSITLKIGLCAALWLGVLAERSFAEDSPATLYFDHFIEIDLSNEVGFKAAIELQTGDVTPGRSTGVWGTHKIITGPRAGQYVRWFGPLHWSALDQQIDGAHSFSPEYEAFNRWPETVRPFLKNITTVIYDADLDSLYEGLGSSDMPLYFMVETRKVKPGMNQRKMAMDAKLAKAYEKAGVKANIINSRILSGGDTQTYVTSFLFNSMAEFRKTQKADSFSKHYETAHGVGSWKRHLKEYNTILQEEPVESELWRFLPELSSKGESIQSN
ncbi:MAG: hypothetical protein H8E20_11770 [Verrucomicrobia bacterium]|nr:hypothetical protein [Verrucomicrobiota bacterium]